MCALKSKKHARVSRGIHASLIMLNFYISVVTVYLHFPFCFVDIPLYKSILSLFYEKNVYFISDDIIIHCEALWRFCFCFLFFYFHQAYKPAYCQHSGEFWEERAEGQSSIQKVNHQFRIRIF